ncbi:uncharacterized protein Z518_07532 [Rhinocladiella mackenziei CBS 650.93]|uniref:Uncharacterized protein n=1 Tax=Rhinocladiella mackenziei CBS 650.93 TaxID=1442369 RepID=A0A0D2IDU2_9EURO|nr:uncharacterized protein Z518_07532 [Rhinocladiella mackenziei CBS 650.93]KIX03979.1 hypothetical protein Z518_07532 [Rhinocladiella mackenziei CBS 650.93]
MAKSNAVLDISFDSSNSKKKISLNTTKAIHEADSQNKIRDDFNLIVAALDDPVGKMDKIEDLVQSVEPDLACIGSQFDMRTSLTMSTISSDQKKRATAAKL